METFTTFLITAIVVSALWLAVLLWYRWQYSRFTADLEAQIKPALADGRLLPALEGWARDLGKKDMAALTAYLGAAKPIAALTGTQTGGIPPATTATGDQQLRAEELAVCSAMGISPEAYRKAGAATATGAAA